MERATVHPVPLALTRLTLTRFRSYDQARWQGDGRPVVLTGPNGAGKTNLLEAVSFLSPGRGLRRARLSEVDRIPAGDEDTPGPIGGWAVATTLETPTGPLEIGTGRDPTTGERRLLQIDGRPAKSQLVLADHVPMVWLTPAMDRLFTESPAGRRRFLDRLVFSVDPDHARRLSHYEHALRERARLLKQQARPDPAWLSTLEAQMAETGVAAALARAAMATRLTQAAAEAQGPFPTPALALAGSVDTWLAEGLGAPETEERLRAALRESRRGDRESGGAGAGPHRSDLAVTYVDKGIPAARGSTGEQKALLVAIVLANARLLAGTGGRPPLLLLDEVVAHLDEDRRAALFQQILATGAQAWMTGTDAALFRPLGRAAQYVRVAPGVLIAAEA